jgi:hypothetical protein
MVQRQHHRHRRPAGEARRHRTARLRHLVPLCPQGPGPSRGQGPGGDGLPGRSHGCRTGHADRRQRMGRGGDEFQPDRKHPERSAELLRLFPLCRPGIPRLDSACRGIRRRLGALSKGRLGPRRREVPERRRACPFQRGIRRGFYLLEPALLRLEPGKRLRRRLYRRKQQRSRPDSDRLLLRRGR